MSNCINSVPHVHEHHILCTCYGWTIVVHGEDCGMCSDYTCSITYIVVGSMTYVHVAVSKSLHYTVYAYFVYRLYWLY